MVTTVVGQPPDNYLLDELLLCLRCNRQMHPAPRVDGTRYYSCGLNCQQPDLPASTLEQDLLFKAMVRAYQALYGVGRQAAGEAIDASGLNFNGPTPRRIASQLDVSTEEVRRWQQCDVTNRRSLLLTALVRVTVDAEGAVRPFWRHEEEAQTCQVHAGALHAD